jgi:anaerobic selenocysteine-containing dehydrogenase
MSTAEASKPPVRSATTQLPAVSGSQSIASVVPFGWNLPGTHPWLGFLQTMRDNLDAPDAAWSILSSGVCDQSPFGVAGLQDGLPGGFHIDDHRRERLRLHTGPALAPADLLDLPRLRTLGADALARLGRLDAPYIHRPGDRGYTKATWSEALDAIAGALPKVRGKRLALLAGEDGLSIEAAYTFAKAGRLLASPHINLCTPHDSDAIDRVLQASLGLSRATASLEDLLDAQLIFVVGTQLSAAESRGRSLLLAAKRRGARIVVLNPIREPSLARVRSGADLRAAFFGARLADDFVEVAAGGDAAFFTGVAKAIVERKGWDRDFVSQRTENFDALDTALADTPWADLEAASGAPRRDMEWVAELAVRADRAVTVVGNSVQQHASGADIFQALTSVHLLRGWLGADGTGLLPLSPSIGTRGAHQAGVHPGRLPGGVQVDAGTAAELSQHWDGAFVPAKPGLRAVDLPAAADKGQLDLLVCLGCDPLHSLPGGRALAAVPVRVHFDTQVRPSMHTPAGQLTVLLPIDGLYAQSGGATVQAADDRIRFSPPLLEPSGEEKAPWAAFQALAERLDPDLADALLYRDSAAVRAELADVVPALTGIDALSMPGDWKQPGGRHGGIEATFPTDSGKATFVPGTLPEREGLQVVARRSPPDGLTNRNLVLVPLLDAKAEGIQSGDTVELTTASAGYSGIALVLPMPAGAVQACVPEAAALFADAPPRRPVAVRLRRCP